MEFKFTVLLKYCGTNKEQDSGQYWFSTSKVKFKEE